MNPGIFREYDIRGIAGEEITEADVVKIGRAYGTMLQRDNNRRITVGRDCRLTSERYSKLFIEGILSTGCDVIDIGVTPTPVLYFSIHHLGTQGGAMVTASHNPKEYNGLKLGVGYSDTMVTREILELREIAEKGEFSSGSGGNRELDIFPAYKKELRKLFDLKKKWKIVVEGCNTASGRWL